MIHFKCQLCRQDITAADQNAGKRAKCPKCQKIIVIPASEPDVEVIEDDSPAEPRPSTAIRKKPETPPPARPRLGGTGPAKKSADDDSDIEELEAVEEDFEVVEEEPEEERPRRSRPTDDDIEHRPPRRRKRRRLPRDDDDEPGNW
ncbi:MAG TPA: hypothetical protein VKI65_09575, partial [Gemmataceae bacterium]|nr:hypothetical protein [Gemmataceae bacterium]